MTAWKLFMIVLLLLNSVLYIAFLLGEESDGEEDPQ